MRDILRQAVLDQLKSVVDRPIVLIQAPAGSGKSTMLGQLQDVLVDHGKTHLIVAKEGDNAQDAFLHHVFQAVQEATGNPDQTPGEFDMDANRLVEQIVRNAQHLKSPLFLLIDNFHLIKSLTTIRLVTRLIYLDVRVPLHLVIASRTDCGIPVSTLRLQGQLLELGPSDLRFSEDEAAALQRDWALDVDPDQWQSFRRKVDGWAVAIKLALVLLKARRLSVDGLLLFSGTQREMADYLSEQLLGGLNDADQRLLFSAAAFDTLHFELLHEVLGESRSVRLMQLTDQLALPLDFEGGEETEVRLHSIILEFLRDRAKRAGVNLIALQKQATDYFADRGKWRQAIGYALKAGDLKLAAEVAEKAGGWRLIYRGEQGTGQQFRHLASLDRSELGNYPRTAMGLAIAAAKRGEIEFAVDLMQFARRSATSTNPHTQTELLLVDALMALYQDHTIPEEAVAQLENSLLQDPAPDMVQVALTQNLLCFASLNAGAFEAAIGFGRQSIASFRASHSNFGAAHLPLHIGQSEYFLGRFASAQSTFEKHVGHCERVLGPHADLTLMAKALLVETQVENTCDAAHWPLIEGALTQLGASDTWYDPLAALVLSGAQLAFIQQDFPRSEALLSVAEDIAGTRRYQRLFDLVALLRIEGLSEAGQLEDARFLLDELRASREENATDVLQCSVAIRGVTPDMLDADLSLRNGELDRARALLQATDDGLRGSVNIPRKIRIEVLWILLLDREDRQAEAEKRLERLVLTTPVDSYRMPFRRSAGRIATVLSGCLSRANEDSLIYRRLSRVAEVLPDSMRSASASRGEAVHFTKSELKILRLLEKGQSNKEIGRALDVSDNTIKYHLANIFRKLGVNTRTAAAMRAQQVHISEA